MIIDSFMFHDELDLLELRLGQLDEVVDYFVFNELPFTHSGKPKPLYYRENIHRFSKWGNKIICSVPNLSVMSPWSLEVAQRKSLEDSIVDVSRSPEDVLSTSDCDEIPNPKVLKSYSSSMGLRNLKQFTFWYNFGHMFDYGSRWSSRARIGTIKNMHDSGGLGNFHGGPKDDMDPNFPSIENAGWHCSYFSDSIERIRRKINSFAHTDLAPYINNRTDKQIVEDIANGVDLYHRDGINSAQKWAENDPRLPPYYLSNRERFSMFSNEKFLSKYQQLLNEAETGQISQGHHLVHRSSSTQAQVPPKATAPRRILR